jgi:hypothetical protein
MFSYNPPIYAFRGPVATLNLELFNNSGAFKFLSRLNCACNFYGFPTTTVNCNEEVCRKDVGEPAHGIGRVFDTHVFRYLLCDVVFVEGKLFSNVSNRIRPIKQVEVTSFVVRQEVLNSSRFPAWRTMASPLRGKVVNSNPWFILRAMPLPAPFLQVLVKFCL